MAGEIDMQMATKKKHSKSLVLKSTDLENLVVAEVIA